MRILFVHHGGARGGAPLCLLDIVRQAKRDGHEPVVAFPEEAPEVATMFGREGVPMVPCALAQFQHTELGYYSVCRPITIAHGVKWVFSLRRTRAAFRELIRRHRPDVVHLNSLTLAPYARVARAEGVPCIVHVREPIRGVRGDLRGKWLVAELNRWASAVIAISADNAERLVGLRAPCHVIPDPVDFSVFDAHLSRESARHEVGINRGSAVVLFPGGSTPGIKGRAEFIRAMGILKKHVPALVCLMPGFDQLEYDHASMGSAVSRIAKRLGHFKRRQAALDTTIEEAGIKDSIVGGPFRYDVEKCFAAANVICVPHIRPHCSLAVNQAGAMKRPVVAFRVGGVEEFVKDGETGWLVECGDVEKLAERIMELLQDSGLADRMGERGYEQARKRFDLEAVVGPRTIAVLTGERG